MIALGVADGGSTYSLSMGDEVFLQLPENPATGYRWEVTLSGNGFLELVENHYDAGGTAPGAAGIRKFRYVALQPGTVSLQAVCKRAWESGEQSRLDFTVVVN